MSDIHVINIDTWLEENKDQFLPPVCNKLMHNEQLNVMYVGGPNIREDYHIEEGEELFYQHKGDMVLKIVEQGQHKDVQIREGECFLLPARIPHSPQRYPNTVGLVIERQRPNTELDVLRYYIGQSTTPLYEKAFHCEDLGTQLKPIIEEYFASKEKASGVPSKESVLESLPFEIDNQSIVITPFNLEERLKHINTDGNLLGSLTFPQFHISVFTQGKSQLCAIGGDHWIWQNQGCSTVIIDRKEYKLTPSSTILVPFGYVYKWERCENSKAILVKQFKE